MSGREAEVLHLFEGYGIELEYMIVDRENLSVRAIADRLLREVGGGYEQEVALGDLAWSNELALHVIELKTNGPAPKLAGLAARFQEHIGKVHRLLEPMGARLMPTAMHPWMDPHRELKLWPHEGDDVYATFDRIFDCKGHGWANLQSMHINLPFANDDELGRLHAAIRVVLPLLPALAASSPIVDGAPTEHLDARLWHYKSNARRVPSVSGHVVPEGVYSRAEYEALLESIYRDLAPLDPEGVIRHEWVNARGCIGRFDRMALEIRVLDTQEHPAADLAVAAAVVDAVRVLVEEQPSSTKMQRALHHRELAEILDEAIRDGDRAVVRHRKFLEAVGHPERTARMGEIWQHQVETHLAKQEGYDEWREPVDRILNEGCLARRITGAVGDEPDRERLGEVYEELCRCLEEGRGFGKVARVEGPRADGGPPSPGGRSTRR